MSRSKRLRVVFFGSPEFAVPTLAALRERHEVLAVVTQPDRPAGRGRLVAAPPVKVVASAAGIPVLQPPTLRRKEVRLALDAYSADVFVVVAFGQILRPRVLAVPRLGCINVHASLLPKLRGAAPIQWAVLNGDARSGVTIMQMDAGVDTGDIYKQHAVELAPGETAGSLHDRLAPIGARLLVDALDSIADGQLTGQPQNHAEASQAPMLSKTDGCVDFGRGAAHASCWVRGMDPWPGAFALRDGQRLRVFGARRAMERGPAGRVLAIDDRGMLVGCGDDSVWIDQVQLPGRRRVSAEAAAAGRAVAAGDQFDRCPK